MNKDLYVNDGRVKNDVFTLNKGLFEIKDNKIIFKMNILLEIVPIIC